MESITPVRPVPTPAPYLGGKRNLAARIIERLRAIPHRTYVEPFVGMGGIFLRRDWRSPAEVINDISGDVTTLFRVLQRLYPYFMDMLRWRLTSRAEFERLKRVDPSTLLDLERAARFLYLQRLAFGGKVRGQNFGVSIAEPAAFSVTKIEPMLAEIHDRLADVVIERLPYAELIRRYDAVETLFYLDPPYWDCERDYGDAFERSDFERLAEQLGSIDGKFVLSINDTPGVREVFSRFPFEAVETNYSVSSGSQSAKELIISNAPNAWFFGGAV